MDRRPYQEAVLGEFVRAGSRFWALLWERQAGKSTTMADFALHEMLRRKDHTVIYASASLLLSQELPIKTAMRANQTISQLVEGDAAILKQFADSAQSILEIPVESAEHPLPSVAALLKLILRARGAGRVVPRFAHAAKVSWSKRDMSAYLPAGGTDAGAEAPVQFKTYDASTGKEIIGGRGASAKRISADGFAELFSQQRLEFRVYYDRTSYSRTKVIAPNIATARSWSGTVLLDEVAFIRNFRELMTALLPVITADKQFKLILATTPPEFDDTHYSFELLAPPAGLKFEPNPEGNWYTSESGIRVYRTDAFDTALAGKKIFDLKTGAEISPQEAYNRAPNKDGHRIAHWLMWMLGGSAACDMLRLRTAQERGAIQQCKNFCINSDADMLACLNWLANNVGRTSADNRPFNSPSPGGEGRGEGGRQTGLARSASTIKIGIGFDVATTTKGKSNPSVVSIMEEHGPEWIVRVRFVWKTNDPAVANDRLMNILDTLLRCGIRPKALAQDATNERYYAEQNRNHFRSRVPVLLVVASQAVNKPGLTQPTNWKEYLGHQLVAKLDDNNLTLPPDDYTRVDYRLVMKDRGKFVCEPNDQGMHGDCFDADKLAGHALTDVNSRRTIIAPMTYVPPPRALG